MPIAKIEVKRQWKTEQQNYIMEATHAAMMEALKIPQHNRLIRFIEHHPAHFLSPPGTSENYCLVEISQFPGRSLEAKHRLYQAIIRRFGEIGISPQDIRIVLHEVPLENWGVRGGIPASEVDLGFEVQI